MRNAFNDQLQEINSRLVEMTALVETAVQRATKALLTADLRLAELVITADTEIDRIQIVVEEETFEALALQQPVAGDLRRLVGTLRMVADLERMGDLAEHVAKVTRLRYPDQAIPEAMRETIAEMGTVAEHMVHTIGETVRTSDTTLAMNLMAEDDHMDKLRRSLFTHLLAPDWTGGVEPAVDIALLGRYYERIADHAVSIARRVVYLVTGDFPEATRPLAP